MDKFNLKKFLSEKSLLNENAPGYDTRKFGGALPTLESVKAAYEAKRSFNEDHKHTYKQIDPDGTAECTKCGLRNSDPSKTGEKVRAGVRSAAEKLGMKPSHVNEGVWNIPTMDEVIEFVAHVEEMKDKFYHIGSDDVFNGLDQAIIAARDLVDPGDDDSYDSRD